jgi:hypothetical protein
VEILEEMYQEAKTFENWYERTFFKVKFREAIERLQKKSQKTNLEHIKNMENQPVLEEIREWIHKKFVEESKE